MFHVGAAATVSPMVILQGDSAAVVSWYWEGRRTTGVNPTIRTTGPTTVRMAVSQDGFDTLEQVETLNLGFDNNADRSTHSPGSGNNYPPQTAIVGIEGVAEMKGLVRFLAAGLARLSGELDFTGMARLRNIELAGSAVKSVTLNGCTSLRRLNVNGNDLTAIDVKPIAGTIREIRAASQRRGRLKITGLEPMPHLSYLDLRGVDLNCTEIDSIVTAVDTWGTVSGTLDLRQNVCYTRVASSAVDRLKQRKWAVRTDAPVVEPPVIVGTTTACNVDENGVTFFRADLPPLRDGDYLVACLTRSACHLTSAEHVCSGFSRISTNIITARRVSSDIRMYVHFVASAFAEPAEYRFTLSGTGASSVGVLLLVRGVDPASPVYGSLANAPGAEPARERGWLVIAAVADEAGAPSAVLDKYTTVASATCTGLTSGQRSSIWVGQEAAYAASPTEWAPQPIPRAAATGEAYWTAALRGLPAVLRPGFESVDLAFTTPGATMSHRGGSLTPGNPEMSSRAYDYSALMGFGILEFSANRTSDGVWIGCHDPSINRTSETSGVPDTSELTWAEVETYLNTLNSGGVPRPYYRLVDFLERWTPTHVVFVDPKAGIGHIREFLDVLDEHGGPEKIVVKFAGPSWTNSRASAIAQARGYTTWGYFFDVAHVNGDLARYGSWYDTLGINHDAPPEVWEAILAYNKPVVAHLISAQDQCAQAISAGADLLQCARPDRVIPVTRV
ncbi:glycerophosphodiester phosphodiesterase family protein [Mycolicibacterium phlei]|uniref:glycerophosphodiester phosphodiesterase family protein n=1 Tax=Mycolicibacterium phlei TaxID=1771 RepID=UPI001E429506|nr:glycerophosphodiester phosphodiesterase family protein [Mycolicibacterium phlei]